MRRLTWIATTAWWIGIFIATHLPPARLPTTHVDDKVEHFVAYFILTILLFASLRLTRLSLSRSIVIAIVIVIVLGYGAIDEQTQKLVGRSCSITDWYADAAGAVAGVAVAALVERLARVIARR